MSPKMATEEETTMSHVIREPENTAAAEPVEAEALIEEVSIDGMCGVY